MILLLLAFLGGALTIVSPCTLPVLPFVFAKTDRPFVRSTLPLLIGMALTFAAVATLAAIGGSWAVRVNSYGRILALALLGLFGLALLSGRVAELLARPAVALGNRLARPGDAGGAGDVTESLVLGIATGLLWAPCAGPILGLILTGAAINGPSTRTTLLLLSYALGAAAALALATLVGRRVFAALKRSLAVTEWLRRGLGVLVLVAVLVIGLGWDTGILTRLSVSSTSRYEQSLLAALHRQPQGNAAAMAMTGGAASGGAMMMKSGAAPSLPIEGELPPLTGAVAWLNSPELTAESLRGKVVLIDFWTYSCINCLRTLPYINSWYERYKDHGLVIIGVHTPEFAFEKELGNVRRAVHDFDIHYPVAVDSNYVIWRAFENQYWPADYFVDAMGRIRGHQFGEGDYDGSERLIRELLTQAGYTELPPPASGIEGQGVQAPPDQADINSPETYVGYARAQSFSSPGGIAQDRSNAYSVPAALALNQWALAGMWTVSAEDASLSRAPGSIAFRFRARDLHLVLGPAADGKFIRFRVTIDGREPGVDHGGDTDAQGNGVVREQRLYQLIRQPGPVGEHTFAIEFLDPGVRAYSFTFG